MTDSDILPREDPNTGIPFERYAVAPRFTFSMFQMG